MFTKICLVLAILAGAGTVAVSHFVVAPKIENLQKEKSDAEAKASAADAAKDAVTKNLNTVKGELTEAKGQITKLQESEKDLTAKAEQADSAKRKAESATAAAKKETENIKAQNADFFTIGKTPDQIRQIFKDFDNTKKELSNTIEERKILQRVNTGLENQVSLLTLGEKRTKTPVPENLVGKVVAVDPKWEFVVLNVGQKDGLLENAELVINRDGKLVGKVRAMQVHETYTIANILKGFKGDISEGDVAVP
jgi:vacuolar-type H+-ATPase subunit I/STV1